MITNYDSQNQPKDTEKTWTTAEMQKEFFVQGFCAPYVIATRKSDNKRGTLEFKHNPRIYFGWKEN